jgi:hypothetical protein
MVEIEEIDKGMLACFTYLKNVPKKRTLQQRSLTWSEKEERSTLSNFLSRTSCSENPMNLPTGWSGSSGKRNRWCLSLTRLSAISSLSSYDASRMQRSKTIILAVFFPLISLIVLPYSHVQLAAIQPFLPAFIAVICFADTLTGYLFFKRNCP